MKLKETWKQNIGFPAIGIGTLVIVASLYGKIERLPPLTPYPHEFIGSLILGLSFILIGLFLTWPRS